MKAFLMYKDNDFDLQRELPGTEAALIQDLELKTLFNAMALGDAFLFEVARSAVLCGLDNDLNTITYRQNVLKDCLTNPSILKEIYDLSVAAIEGEKKNYWSLSWEYPAGIVHRSMDVLQAFVASLKKLRALADAHAGRFESEGFSALFAMLQKELDDQYFAGVRHHLRELRFRGGVLISAELGKGNKGTKYVLREPPERNRNWIEEIFGQKSLAPTKAENRPSCEVSVCPN